MFCYNNLQNTMKIFQIPLVLSTYTQAFFPKGPLQQIAISRAVTSTITEALALNVFDLSALMHQLECECENHPYLPIYVAGFVTFSYLYFVRNSDDRLQKNTFYSNTKQNLRFSLLLMFLLLGKNVENAI